MNNRSKKRILLTRTDRLGDFVLTTPAIKAVRDAYPDAYIAMIVTPYTKKLAEGNPYIDEVIVYDKQKKEKSLLGGLRFALSLRKKEFDRAIIFHPTNRMHIITYIANIPRRIGYDKKCGFLLTDKIRNLKHLGQKHEKDYTLEMLKALGIESDEKELFVPVTYEAELAIDSLLKSHGIAKKHKLVIMHPGASCVSKIWPSERFAKLADKLIDEKQAKIIVVGGNGKRDLFCVDSVKKFMLNDAIFLKGTLNTIELAALLKRATLFISNDSGPVHVAAAVSTPVIDIFGRNQPGLSPTVWGPLGLKDVVLHKDVGCKDVCLAHNCNKTFACLRAISVDEVYEVIESSKLL